jgi:hypothetical protein
MNRQRLMCTSRQGLRAPAPPRRSNGRARQIARGPRRGHFVATIRGRQSSSPSLETRTRNVRLSSASAQGGYVIIVADPATAAANALRRVGGN